jgi:glucan phosphoethanolaminetransferase (alkaline phosphatase superfamily)
MGVHEVLPMAGKSATEWNFASTGLLLVRAPTIALRQRTFQPRSGAVSIIISILITFLVVILVLYLINMLPLDGRAKQIARVIVIIIGIVSLLKYLAVF